MVLFEEFRMLMLNATYVFQQGSTGSLNILGTSEFTLDKKINSNLSINQNMHSNSYPEIIL